MPFHKDKGAGPGKDLLQIPSLIAQKGGELPAQTGGVLDLAGMGHHGRDPGADGQLGAVTVLDHASHRQDGAIFLIFPGSLFPEFRPPYDLEVKKSAADIQAEGQKPQGHQADAQPDPFAGDRVHGRFTTWEVWGAPMSYSAASFSKR